MSPRSSARRGAGVAVHGDEHLDAVRITLDLLLDDEGRPSGSVWAGESRPHPVLGWLELMSELTRLLSDHGPDGAAP